MRYAGGYDSNKPWNERTNPLVLRRNESWRMYPNRDFSGGSMEGVVSTTSQVSDYLDSSGYVAETIFLSQRGFSGPSDRPSWAEMYPATDPDEMFLGEEDAL